MLHYSNASSIEKNRRYLVIKGGLAWLLSQGGVVNTVVELGVTGSLGVYRKEWRGNTINNKATKASQNITRQYAVLGVPNRGSR